MINGLCMFNDEQNKHTFFKRLKKISPVIFKYYVC